MPSIDNDDPLRSKKAAVTGTLSQSQMTNDSRLKRPSFQERQAEKLRYGAKYRTADPGPKPNEPELDFSSHQTTSDPTKLYNVIEEAQELDAPFDKANSSSNWSN